MTRTTVHDSSGPSLPRTVIPSNTSPPRFEDLPVPPEARFRGRPASVDLTTHLEARMYRTRLREAAAAGPNFAGHYTVASIGCGTECQRIGIVDARTGRVWIAPWITNVGSRYRLESNLFVVNPEEQARPPVEMGAAPERYVTRYYEWTGRGLVLVDTVMYVPQ